MAFDREISDEMIHALNLEYEKGKDGWWRKLADHDDTLIAIRDKYLNVYYNGCNVAKVEFKNKKLKASIHYKYLLKKICQKIKILTLSKKVMNLKLPVMPIFSLHRYRILMTSRAQQMHMAA